MALSNEKRKIAPNGFRDNSRDFDVDSTGTISNYRLSNCGKEH